MHQSSSAAAAALYETTGPGVSGGDAGDAVTSRWLQSAGLQHLASPMASNAVDHRMLPNLLMQGYGPQSMEEKQRLFKLMRNLNFNGENISEPYTPSAQSSGPFAASDGNNSPEFSGDFGAGLLDLHSMDDTELLSDNVISEPFEPSPFPAVTNDYDSDTDGIDRILQGGKTDFEGPAVLSTSTNEKECTKRESNVAKIKVVVRKRPLNKKEVARKEDDVVSVSGDTYLTVHEPKLKVDLTAYVEKHEFCFDAVFSEHVTNDEVYRETVEPIIPTIFQSTKATCFAYGQTGSGKTYTMQPLPLRAAQDLVRMLCLPIYRNQRFKLWLSYFEIYGGKLFDLLSDRKLLFWLLLFICIENPELMVNIDIEFLAFKNVTRKTEPTLVFLLSTSYYLRLITDYMVKQLCTFLSICLKKFPVPILYFCCRKLCMRENGRQQVCIVGLQEFEVSDVQLVKEYIDRGNAARSTGSTGANEESSRSHAILQLAVKKHNEVKESRRNNDGDESMSGKVVGKISFIDLAGSERGADTTDNDRQTRIEGAEINKSLLALKECIRALDNDQIHIPFRGSKLTEVLRDSFVGNSRTVMISCISPNAGSCEHTLNTLRYADRVKSLSKSGNPKKDQASSLPSSVKESSSTPSLSVSTEAMHFYEQQREAKSVDPAQWVLEKETSSCTYLTEDEKQPSNLSSNIIFDGREEHVVTSGGLEKERCDVKNAFKVSTCQKMNSIGYSQNSAEKEVKVLKVSPPRQKAYRDERLERPGLETRKGSEYQDMSASNYRQQNANNSDITNTSSKQYMPDRTPDDSINEILEEEEALIVAHRKEIEDTMEIVREEMKLLAEVDQPGSHIDNYVTQLSFVLSRKASSLVSLQAHLARFQHRLKEQEILSRKRVHR